MVSSSDQLECHFRNMLIGAKREYMNALRVLLAEFNAANGPNYNFLKFAGAIHEINQLLWRYILEKGNMRTVNALRSLQFMGPNDDIEMQLAIYNLTDDLEMLYLTEQHMYLCSHIERSIWTDFIGRINATNEEGDFVQSYTQHAAGTNMAEESRMPLTQALADLDLDSSELDETEQQNGCITGSA